MSQKVENFRMDQEGKTGIDKADKERRIPFHSEANMKYLNNVIEEIDTGKAKLAEHELIEE